MYAFFFILDAAEVIETRVNDQAGGRHEYYIHYDGCKYISIGIQSFPGLALKQTSF